MRNISFGENKASLIDRLLSCLRMRSIKPHLESVDYFVDLGCGYHAVLLREVLGKHSTARGLGADLSIDHTIDDPGLKLECKDLNFENVSLDDGEADLVTSLAVIEHLERPEHLLTESFRLLKSGGKLILTAPSPWARPVLNFLAYDLGVMDRLEVDDHKNYFGKGDLKKMLVSAGFKEDGVRIRSLLFGFNNLVVGIKS